MQTAREFVRARLAALAQKRVELQQELAARTAAGAETTALKKLIAAMTAEMSMSKVTLTSGY